MPDKAPFSVKSGYDYNWELSEEKKFGFNPNLGIWIRCRYDADMKFNEEFELHSFPFDVWN